MEARRLTTAVANAIAITLDEKARAAYSSNVQRADELERGDDVGQSASEYRATLARLGAIAPDAVKVH